MSNEISLDAIHFALGVRTECRYDVDCIENAYCFHQFVCRCKNELQDWKDDLNCPGEIDFYSFKVNSCK